MAIETMLSQALKLYDFKDPKAEFIRHNENITYKISDIDKKYLLRIHKSAEGFTTNIYSGYSNGELIQSEIEIISALKKGTKLSIQTPVSGIDGKFVQVISNDLNVTLLEWIAGENVQKAGTTPELLFNAGKMIAEMHTYLSTVKMNYKRYNYDQTVLPIITNRIENAASLAILKPEQAKIILAALDEMKIRFDELDNIQERHIIHADLGKLNMIVSPNGTLTPIDFSLCGYGYFYMDINMFNGDLVFSHDIINGYKSVRKCEITPRYMEPHVALGFLLFVAAQYERAKDWDWFPNTVDNMCRNAFQPLADNVNFVTI